MDKERLKRFGKELVQTEEFWGTVACMSVAILYLIIWLGLGIEWSMAILFTLGLSLIIFMSLGVLLFVALGILTALDKFEEIWRESA